MSTLAGLRRLNKPKELDSQGVGMTLETAAHIATIVTAAVAVVAGVVGVWYAIWVKRQRSRVVNYYLGVLHGIEDAHEEARNSLTEDDGEDHWEMHMLFLAVFIQKTLLVNTYSRLVDDERSLQIPVPKFQWPITLNPPVHRHHRRRDNP
ncbi:MAG: hypothetical protein F4X72_10495 [Dehalococcoidia bacterium]|nr:hypothetical protein [Dehalococcoidia bacterium]